ncbi:o-succinylbenzoate synthase [Cryomorphaceae bacterium 1068]|nr:o-succinylbenzoate synthase [Cryomorphaceae bacterium 1068]
MRKAEFLKHTLNFKSPGGTSRGVLRAKPAWIVKLEENGKVGYGEVSLLPKLSIDDRPDLEDFLTKVLEDWALGKEIRSLKDWPSIRFAMEIAERSIRSENPFLLFPSRFSQNEEGVEINGLVWMGTKAEMKTRIREKLDEGFRCIKLKIGAINFDDEIELLRAIRNEYSPDEIELRVDANGAFSPEEALEKLKRLSDFNLHSIEQPIRQKQWEEMARLCESTPLDIALDEELIGVTSMTEMGRMLETIRPQAIVIKPGLVGGLQMTEKWIKSASKIGAYWWITSALESNIGLNAIAQFTAMYQSELPQGLGTGQLYTNNIPSPLSIRGQYLHYLQNEEWKLPPNL